MSDTQIDSLSLEITSSANEACNGLDALTKSLKKLQRATGKGLGLTAISNDLKNANFDGSAQKIQSLVDALKPLESIGKTRFTSIATAFKKLPEALNAIDTRALYTKVQSLTRIFAPLAEEMDKVARGFSVLPTKIQRLIKETDKIPKSNNKASMSYINLYAKLKMVKAAVMGIARTIAGWINESSEYTETLNLFTVAMGGYAREAYDYAHTVERVMGIDPADWMHHQSIFMTLADGFGVASDRAYTMSQQLTQLGYDLASFYNIGTEDAMLKLQSGIAGELEPLRRLGYDLSNAKLEAVALSLGIDKAVSSMTQAEKAELRYYAIMTQVTKSHGDMARTLNAPANQLRILNAQVKQLGRSLGNFFIPLLNKTLPYIIGAVKVLREMLDVFMNLLGIELATVDFGEGSITSATEDIVENLEDGEKEAKKLKNHMLGFDELNIFNTQDGELEDILGTAFDFELPTYDFMGSVITTQLDEIVNKMKEWLGLTEPIDSWADLLDTKLGNILTNVTLIGATIGAWKVATGTLAAIKALSKLKGFKIDFSIGLAGAVTFMSDLGKLKDFIKEFSEEGATFTNVSGMLSEFAGLVGDAMIMLGNIKLGGALKAVQGVGEIISAISDMSHTGINFSNITDAVRGMTNLGIAIGVMTGNLKITGVAMIIQGFTDVIHEIADNWEAIKKGDWSGVDKATLAIGAIEIIAGIAMAIIALKGIQGISSIGSAAATTADVAEATATISANTTLLSTKLTGLIKNLGLGIAVIAEVAAAVALMVGAVWALGLALEQVNIAWDPVLKNAESVAIAVGVGTGILVGVGVITAALGYAGSALIANIALGIAMLALLGVSTGLFLAEIWAIALMLNEIHEAWKPVLANGENIAKAIGIGTALLVGIGVVAAALGVAAVATAGTLPLAIALGTAMLLELGFAFGEFCKNLSGVANSITFTLSPALSNVNRIIPDATTHLNNFIEYMKIFANNMVRYTTYTAISGIASTVDIIIDFFITDPIDRLSKNVKKQYDQAVALLKNLNDAIPKVQEASRKMDEFNAAMSNFKKSVSNGSSPSGTLGYILTFGVNVLNTASTWWESVKSWWNQKVGSVSSFSTNVTDNSYTWWNNVKTWWNQDSRNGVDVKVNAVKAWSGTVMSALGIPSAFSLGFNLPRIRVKWGEKEVLGFKISFPSGFETYAQGGFPDMGQMFIAREAGPELVGTIGNRNAVVNNEQIVESVSTGVYQAVLAALGGNSDDGDTNIIITLDGEKIYENQQKIARGRGYNLGMGAFSFG